MYEYEQRVYNLGATSGVSPEVVNVFTSRIPKEIIKTSVSGKQRYFDGDKIVLPVLDRLYDLKGAFSRSSMEKRNVTFLYQMQEDKKSMSFARFALLKYLLPTFHLERTTISDRKVFFPVEISILTLPEDEVSILYNWITNDIR